MQRVTTWNQKNLDYEIETCEGLLDPVLRRQLEIKRTSITRLKHEIFRGVGVDSQYLKSKEPRLRDWNRFSGAGAWSWTSWNQKNLDYEIETLEPVATGAVVQVLEIKRTSITRLKRDRSAQRKNSTQPWNQKNLDYEIETPLHHLVAVIKNDLKSKEPRLRDWNKPAIDYDRTAPSHLKSKEPRLRDWNCRHARWGYRILRLEIKRTSITRLKHYCGHIRNRFHCYLEIKRTSITRLKQSTLHYIAVLMFILKSKEPRLRDWNLDKHLESVWESESVNLLKSKEPRLRDWNGGNVHDDTVEKCLEIKRTSITRLKQSKCWWVESLSLNLKSKEPRLRDWNRQSGCVCSD